jgi:hypothetical protein
MILFPLKPPLPEVWLGLWIEGFDGIEGEREGKGFIFVKMGKFMENSFKEGGFVLLKGLID